MTRVLVVDDEPQLLRALRINLRARDYAVEVAADGTTALRRAGSWHPDLVVLDLGLPDLEGIEVIHGLRGWTEVPIIVLSGRPAAATRSRRWRPVPTTMSPSRSTSRSWSPASGPCPAGRRPPSRSRPSRWARTRSTWPRRRCRAACT